ncbi:MAG: SCP2 sterol-binding domain-containing protein [Candidatus Helarchaeota archaeon]
MNFYDLICSKMMMNTLLYSISELSKLSNKVKHIINDHQLNIQVSVEQGPQEFLEIKNGKIFFERHKKLPSYDAKIHFKDPNDFLKIFKKEKLNFKQLESEEKIEIIEKPEFEDLCITLLNSAIPYANNTLGEKVSPEDELILVKIIIHALLTGFQEIVEADENVQIEMKGVDVIIQFNIIDGPQAFFHFNDGKFSGQMDSKHPNPTVKVIMNDIKTALALLTGQGNAARMLIKNQIQIEGDYSHAMKLMNLRELVSDYQDYIKAKRGS